MDEFKPEDELKPDTSDRRPVRQRKVSAIPKIALSRQHVMMIVGILVLLLLVIGIGSALTTPGNQHSQETQTVSTPPASSAAPGSSRTIDLSGSSSMSQTSANNGATVGNHQQISVPAVSPTPTEAPVLPEPANQRRIEVPGDLNHALENNQDQEQLNTVAHGAQSSISSLPTAPASVAPLAPQAVRGAGNKPVAVKSPVAKEPSRPSVRETVGNNAAHRQAPVHATSPSSTVGAGNPLKGEYTLQLSGASQAESLNRWAKNQNLTSYHVYKTERNGQPWYVLVSGAYANPAEAKRAVSSLPAEVRAQNPWVKPVSQVKKEIKK